MLLNWMNLIREWLFNWEAGDLWFLKLRLLFLESPHFSMKHYAFQKFNLEAAHSYSGRTNVGILKGKGVTRVSIGAHNRSLILRTPRGGLILRSPFNECIFLQLSPPTPLIDLISFVFPHQGVTWVECHLGVESFLAGLLPPEFLNARLSSCTPSFKAIG